MQKGFAILAVLAISFLLSLTGLNLYQNISQLIKITKAKNQSFNLEQAVYREAMNNLEDLEHLHSNLWQTTTHIKQKNFRKTLKLYLRKDALDWKYLIQNTKKDYFFKKDYTTTTEIVFKELVNKTKNITILGKVNFEKGIRIKNSHNLTLQIFAISNIKLPSIYLENSEKIKIFLYSATGEVRLSDSLHNFICPSIDTNLQIRTEDIEKIKNHLCTGFEKDKELWPKLKLVGSIIE